MEGSIAVLQNGEGTYTDPIALPVSFTDAASQSQRAAVFTVGSAPDCDLSVQGGGLDPQHFSFTWGWNHATWIIENLSSSQLEVETRRLNRGETLPLLMWQTELFCEGANLRFKFQRRPAAPLYQGEPAVQIPLSAAGLMIGRGIKNKDGSDTPRLGLDRSMRAIATTQAEIRKEGPDYILVNHNPSPAGRTIVNGDMNFDQRKLVFGDCISIPNCDFYTFKFTGTALRYLGQGGSLQGLDLSVDVPQGRILHTVNLELKKGGFMGIIGGSGQGKSTLMNSLCGIVPATSGGVYVDGAVLGSPRDVTRAGIAYVPQDDIVHKELTVEEALYYSARLRLRTTPSQLKDLLDATIDTLRLTPHRAKRITNLSGGQRKRVSIASELLVGPDYIFLDEPTSGLDPQTERSLMGELSLLARHKRIGVAATTHVLQNCHVMTQLAFISRGRLIFHGHPVDAVRFFILSGSPERAALNWRASTSTVPANGSEEPGGSYDQNGEREEFSEADLLSKVANIYDIAQDTTKPVPDQDRESEAWQNAYHDSKFFTPPAPMPANPAKIAPPQQVPALTCLWLLISRQWKILISSKLNYLFLAAQALVIGLLISWVNENLVLQMFLALIATLWFGCSNGAQQIVSELAIFRRERLAGLGIHTYLASKFLFYGVITALQGIILFSMILITSPIFHPESNADDVEAQEEYDKQVSEGHNPEKPEVMVADFTGHTRNKTVREFRKAFFDDDWSSLSKGKTNHDFSDAPAPAASVSPTKNPADFEVMGDDPVAGKSASKQGRVVYMNPANLSPDSGEYLLLEKVAFFLRVQDNALDSLGVKKVMLEPSQSVALLRFDYARSWKGFFFHLMIIRFGALLLGALVGVALGIAVSSLVDTPTQSVMWVPLILIPQILFGSFVVIIPEMNDAVLAFSKALPSFNLQEMMDVGLVYGRLAPRLTNQTKIPAFLSNPPNSDEIVKWSDTSGGKHETKYDRISQVNKSWQNLTVSRELLGMRDKERNDRGDIVNQVEKRADVQVARGDLYSNTGPARLSGFILVIWAIGCYTVAAVALYKRQTGR